MLTAAQRNHIIVVTAIPFLLLLFLNFASPGYMSQVIHPAPAYSMCTGSMVMMFFVFQGLVAALLRTYFLYSNKQQRKVSEYKRFTWLRGLVAYSILLVCVCLTLSSMWIVLMGPAIIQVMSTNPNR
jgi:hypothetical protein